MICTWHHPHQLKHPFGKNWPGLTTRTKEVHPSMYCSPYMFESLVQTIEHCWHTCNLRWCWSMSQNQTNRAKKGGRCNNCWGSKHHPLTQTQTTWWKKHWQCNWAILQEELSTFCSIDRRKTTRHRFDLPKNNRLGIGTLHWQGKRSIPHHGRTVRLKILLGM